MIYSTFLGYEMPIFLILPLVGLTLAAGVGAVVGGAAVYYATRPNYYPVPYPSYSSYYRSPYPAYYYPPAWPAPRNFYGY